VNLCAAFLLGLAGSLHCAVMCGPLVLALAAARRGCGNPALNTLIYHGGRILLYVALGAVSGLAGAALAFAGLQRWISIAAGLTILLTIFVPAERLFGVSPALISLVKSRFSKLLRSPRLAAVALLGALNGLLPCGLVYVACAVAAASGGVAQGALTMLAFGLGSSPMLLSIAFAGRKISPSNPLRLRRVVLACSIAAGILLTMRGLSLGIPYLSPDLSHGRPECPCHSSSSGRLTSGI